MRLVPLKELDGYRLADGEPDIRGWPVQTLSGRKIGEIDDVLVDQSTGEVVLLDVDLDGTKRRTLAPARAVQLQRDRRVVLIDSIELRDAEQLPTLARTGEVTAEELARFRDNYSQLYGQRAFHEDRDYDIQRRDQQVRLSRHEGADRAERDEARSEYDHLGHREQEQRDERQRDEQRREQHAAGTTPLPPPTPLAAPFPPRSDNADAQTATGAQAQPADTVRSTSVSSRDVRFPKGQGDEEVVVERRPVVMEEVVVRRRIVDPNEASATDAVDAQRLRDRGKDEELR
ncbi:MAG TPA: PRC-barrel domain-containing protein [Gemmatimonadaceae bacterium]|nr:PRC-barrel domain-containing protein [Gemmatimonadaceae bacterium]